MATAKKEEIKEKEIAARPDPNERVTYTAPLVGIDGNKQDIFVAVNGETLRIKRGATVQIKRKFLKVLENADKQALAAYKYREEAMAASRRSMADM